MGDLVLKGSTSGQITVTPTAVAGTNTLTLPAATGNIITSADSGTVTGTMIASATVAPSNLSQPLTRGTSVASTSGTSIDFTSIPSWVKRVTVVFDSVSTNGTANLLLQIGAGSVTSSGYSSSVALVYGTNNTLTSSSTSGIIMFSNAASNIIIGSATLQNITGNTWVGTIIYTTQTNGQIAYSAGSVALSGTLDRVRITTSNGTDAFDAGTINIFYE